MAEHRELTGMDPEDQAGGSFDRAMLLLGEDGLERLKNACVHVLGLGGVGSNCAIALARAGVGHLVLVDRDCVSPTNINRQAVALHSTLGRVKAEVMREMVLDINPDCDVTAVHAFIARDRAAEQLDALPRPDWVVDAIDTIAQKLSIVQWCQDRGYRLTCSGGAANKLDPTRFRFADISKTCADPVARVLRKECRKRGIKHLEMLFSDEVPIEPDLPEDAELDETGRPDRSLLLGTMSYMPAVMGQMIAGRVICGLTGVENPLAAQRNV